MSIAENKVSIFKLVQTNISFKGIFYRCGRHNAPERDEFLIFTLLHFKNDLDHIYLINIV